MESQANRAHASAPRWYTSWWMLLAIMAVLIGIPWALAAYAMLAG